MKVRIVAVIDEDVFDELCSYRSNRVDIISAEEADDNGEPINKDYTE